MKSQRRDSGYQLYGPNETPVYYNEPVPDDVMKDRRDDQGHKLVAIAPVLTILDPTMKAMISKFPGHSENYEAHVRKGKDGDVPDPSFLVVIPRTKGNGLFDSQDAAAVPPPLDATSAPGAESVIENVPTRSVGATPSPGTPSDTDGGTGLRRVRRY